jgi:hypothetical protein
MTSVRIPLSSGVLKLLLALALVVGVGLMFATPAVAQQASGQYSPPTSRFVTDIDRVEIDEGSAAPTSSGRAPVVGTASPGGDPVASPTSSGRAPLVATSPEADKAEAAGKATSGRSAVQGVLPATGGPLLPIILLAGLALAGTGMLVLQRFSGRE